LRTVNPIASLEQSVAKTPFVRQSAVVASVSVTAGKKGVGGGWLEGGVQVSPEDAKTGKRTVDEYGTTGISTLVGGVGHAFGKNHGWYGGVSAPFLSVSKGNPVTGDSVSVFIPMVASATLTSKGGIGVSATIPFFGIRAGASVFLMNPAFKAVTQPVIGTVDKVVMPAVAKVESIAVPAVKQVEAEAKAVGSKARTPGLTLSELIYR
jgi:hypothetical protein